jgi:hypothetical protein
MPEKVKKNILGRTVVKTKSDDGSVSRSVYGRKGQLVKSKSKMNSDGNKSVTKIKGNTIKNKTTGDLGSGVTKKKTTTYSNPASKTSVTKQTLRGPGGSQRSVTVKKPGEKFVTTGLGRVSQAKTYSYYTKKNK